MKEYIERVAILDAVKRTSGDYMAVWSEIAHMQAADVVPVVHGKWVEKPFLLGTTNECSNCNDFFWNATR